jgi:hypothetical protein
MPQTFSEITSKQTALSRHHSNITEAVWDHYMLKDVKMKMHPSNKTNKSYQKILDIHDNKHNNQFR